MEYWATGLITVGSYSTRNILVIELEQQNDCIDFENVSVFFSYRSSSFQGDSPNPVVFSPKWIQFPSHGDICQVPTARANCPC
jgi:hypothetical protein